MQGKQLQMEDLRIIGLLNSGNYINSFVNGSGQVKLSSDAKKTEESVFL